MTKFKKNFFFFVKSALALVAFLTLILFFYAAFFYNSSTKETKTLENEATKEEVLKGDKDLKSEEEAKKVKKQETENKTKIQQLKTTLKDGMFAVVGDKAVTRSDILNEMKSILILNNMVYSDEVKSELQQMAVKSIIKKNIKKIEINKRNFLEYDQQDLNKELNKIANKINIDVPTLKKICESNGLDFSLVEDKVKTDLLWNTLIFYLYSNRVTVNLSEIDEQLKLYQNKRKFNEFLISEIILKPVESSKLESEIEKVKKEIEIEGFEKVAMNLSISSSAVNGGDLGWLNESKISDKFKSIIFNTPVGGLSQPVLLKDGILIFQIRDKRIIEKEVNLEELKNQLVNSEKTKMLNMYSKSHYDNLKRSTPVKFLNE